MQKLLRRAAAARRGVQRKAKERSRQEFIDHKQWSNKKIDHNLRDAERLRKYAVQARHEDWEMGPLAPRRDTTAPLTEHLMQYGAISQERVRFSMKPRERDLNRMCEWAGGVDKLCLAVDDRVVIMEGPFKGKIGTISTIHKDEGSVQLKRELQANIPLPGFMTDEHGAAGQAQLSTMEAHIPIHAIRLVHPLVDPYTGATRDCIIRELQPQGGLYDPIQRELAFDRVVPGLNTRIPWPRRPAPTFETFPCDTLRIDSDAKSFVPTLLRPPMPPAVLDELRNKYSKFRTRHTPEYIAKKEAQAAARKKGVGLEKMRMPLEEFHLLERERRRARGKPELTEDMLVKIGEVIVKNQARILEGSGIVDVGAAEPPVAASQENRETSAPFAPESGEKPPPPS